MKKTPGHESGHAVAADGGHGLSWREYVDDLVERHGSLAAVAERLSRQRAYKEDVASIERALRRLRTRKQEAGGTWGERALATFGLPGAAAARTKWMGQYHSRFTDLPLPLCLDLVRLWDRPPVSEEATSSAWLALAHASCALRAANLESAAEHVQRARAAKGEPAARIETALVDAFITSRREPNRVPALLDEAESLLAPHTAPHDAKRPDAHDPRQDAKSPLATRVAPHAAKRPDAHAPRQHAKSPLATRVAKSLLAARDAPHAARSVSTDDAPHAARSAKRPDASAGLAGSVSADDVACLRARLVDQRAYALNRAGAHAEAEALFAALATSGPPFALYRRASGLAWAAWKARGDRATAAALAREACEHAGDGGHLRVRAMALQTLARILGDKNAEARTARERAAAIVAALDDEALRLRFKL